MSLRPVALLLVLVAACDSPSANDPPATDAGSSDGGGDDADVPLCSSACGTEANADVACTVFHTCESTCDAGFARCEGACVAESAQQCGDGCAPCPTPANGSATCSDGVCGVACEPGFVACDGYSGPACCAFASEVVAPAELGGYMPSLAVDADNRIHLAYYRSAEHELVYAGETATGLVREAARWYWSSGGGARFALALGARGPLIAYTYPNSLTGLYLAERRTTGWSQLALVTDTTPGGFGIATDRGGRPHVCFTTSAGLHYAIRRGDVWTTTALGEADATGACAIAVDGDGLPHIAFFRATAGDLAYAKGSASGAFTTTLVDTAGTVGREVAIAVAPDGTPHIAAYRSDTEDLRWATLANGAWSVQDVSAGRVGASPRITVGTTGLPVVTWFDYDLYRVVIAARTASQTWTEQVFEDIAGGWGALASAPDGSTWVATGDGSVLARQLANGTAASYAIDLETAAGSDVSLVHRSPTQPIVISDATHDGEHHVEIAERTGSTWARTQLATPGSAASAAVDASTRLHVAYQTGTAISYAVESGSGFAIEQIAANASAPSIAIGAQGPVVAYVATQAGTPTTYALVVATRGASGWTPVTIGAPGPYDTYRKPIVRSVGGVTHVLWWDNVAKAIAYASSADGYTKVIVEANTDGGHDLYVSPAGVPHACVTRKAGSWPDLRYATRTGTAWSSVLVPVSGSRLNSGRCAIGADASGTIAIARSMVYGAGLGEIVLTTLGATTTHASLQDDFYGAALGISLGANGLEVAMVGEPYNGSGGDQNRVRWVHR